jgi:hypothetical protein
VPYSTLLAPRGRAWALDAAYRAWYNFAYDM